MFKRCLIQFQLRHRVLKEVKQKRLPVSRRYNKHMPFCDRVKTLISSGSGGDGACSFEHLYNLEFGGPNGGCGGNGGHVYLKVSHIYPDLAHIQALGPHITAASGAIGRDDNMGGKYGQDFVIEVPPGTQVTNVDTNEIVYDFGDSELVNGKEVMLLEGGKGGRGNATFTTDTNHAPREFTRGMPGNNLLAQIELKTLCDIGFVGYPNAGKSTLLAALTTAQPKIAAYPFTTLHPTVGKLHNQRGQETSLADLPGLIEGSYENRGLGHQFLRHVERSHYLAIVLDMVDSYMPPEQEQGAGVPQQPWEVLDALQNELEFYSAGLSDKIIVVFANKMDIPHDSQGQSTKEKFTILQQHYPHYPIYPISAHNGLRYGIHHPEALGLGHVLEFLFQQVQGIKAREKDQKRQAEKETQEELEESFFQRNIRSFAVAPRRNSKPDHHYGDEAPSSLPFHEVLQNSLLPKSSQEEGGVNGDTRPLIAERPSFEELPPHSSSRGKRFLSSSSLLTRRRTKQKDEEDATPEVDRPKKQKQQGQGQGDLLLRSYLKANPPSLVDGQMEMGEEEGGIYAEFPNPQTKPLVESKLRKLQDPTTKGQYWKLTREKNERLTDEDW